MPLSAGSLNLKQFMIRLQVIKLYRDFLKVTRDVADEKSRKELRDWIRTDFKNNKHHTDEYTIKLLILNGTRSLKQLQQNLAMTR